MRLCSKYKGSRGSKYAIKSRRKLLAQRRKVIIAPLGVASVAGISIDILAIATWGYVTYNHEQ